MRRSVQEIIYFLGAFSLLLLLHAQIVIYSQPYRYTYLEVPRCLPNLFEDLIDLNSCYVQEISFILLYNIEAR